MMIFGVPDEIRIGNFLNTSQKNYSFCQSARRYRIVIYVTDVSEAPDTSIFEVEVNWVGVSMGHIEQKGAGVRETRRASQGL
jgi:hypothetical protein